MSATFVKNAVVVSKEAFDIESDEMEQLQSRVGELRRKVWTMLGDEPPTVILSVIANVLTDFLVAVETDGLISDVFAALECQLEAKRQDLVQVRETQRMKLSNGTGELMWKS